MGIPESKCAYKREYFAKDVGLIMRESRSYPTDTIYEVDFELIDHHINF